MFWTTKNRLAILFCKEGIHLWHGAKRLDHCVTDQVGK